MKSPYQEVASEVAAHRPLDVYLVLLGPSGAKEVVEGRTRSAPSKPRNFAARKHGLGLATWSLQD
jgi:hypothetical protein